MWETITTSVIDAFGPIFGLQSRVGPLYLATYVGLAFVLYLFARGTARSFVDFVLPRRIWAHRSSLVDLKVFLFARFFSLLGLASFFAVAPLFAHLVTSLLGVHGEGGDVSPWLVGLLVVAGSDFGLYWIHRLHHELPVFWPFHSVHHSAEVLTPLTLYRKHPVYDLSAAVFRSAGVGLVQGVLIALFVGKVDVAMLFGINAFYFGFNFIFANFRHSHIWIRFPRPLEYLFISPAMHQIHHSRAPKHHDRNYGEMFAIWDWMFGTIYVPRGKEELEFGLAERDGTPIDQPHPTLRAALLVPFRDSYDALVDRKPEQHDDPVPTPVRVKPR